MNGENLMNGACGAKTKNGGRCKLPPVSACGRCRLHGGKGSGRPPTHGRGSTYARVFGQQFKNLLTDPDLLSAGPELALFDTFLAERAELLGDGLSAEWLKVTRATLESLRVALFVSPDPAQVKDSFKSLSELLNQGGERMEAWSEMLAAAKARGELAQKAAAVVSKQESQMTDARLVVILGKMLDIFTDVAGSDLARKAATRFEREVIGRVEPGATGTAVTH